jgi:hypothetical protein
VPRHCKKALPTPSLTITGETESWEKLFPELAASLPAEEAETLTSEFQSELTRLRSAG